MLTARPTRPGTAKAGRRPRGFDLYFTARVVSLLGDAMLQVALTVAVLDAGFGTSGVGYALAAWLAPVALLVLFGGALADRFEPRNVMVAADAVRTVTQLVFALSFAAGAPALWQILALQAAGGAATAMFTPGSATMVPRLTADIQRGNAALRIAEAFTTLLGPALGGLLLAGFGAAAVFGADAASFALSALCLTAIRLGRPQDRAARPAPAPMWRALAEGWQEFRSRTWLWSVIALWSLYGLLVFGPALPLSAAVVVAAHGSAGFAAVTSAFGAGTVAGALLALRFRPVRPLAAGALSVAAFALSPLVVAVPLPLLAVVAGNLAAGTGFAFWGVLWATTLQTQVPPAVLSRVAAYDVAGSVLALPAGRALAGPAASAFGPRALLTVCTAGALLISAAMLAVPAIRNLRTAAPTPAPSVRPSAFADPERAGRDMGTAPEPDLEPAPAPSP
ncbi:MFS transporter [Actinacidiphila acididurans]|uniref:MFS transporter n=1 Tax=Actinacidiphila acididurans TaxID=2784346 RepID=A0ABS2U4D4_9ACTN|nr:MFS transporter [Actinacidiphila acididurans]MBM9510478.1 MFS transporter [Actinacidiphila acididurans]